MLVKGGRVAVNWVALLMRNVAEIVDRIADHVHDATQSSLTHRHADRPTRVSRFHSADHSVCWQHRNGAHAAFAEVLLDFRDNVDSIRYFETIGGNPQRLVDRRQVAFPNFNVDHRADNLHYFSDVSVRTISVGRSHIYSINSSK